MNRRDFFRVLVSSALGGSLLSDKCLVARAAQVEQIEDILPPDAFADILNQARDIIAQHQTSADVGSLVVAVNDLLGTLLATFQGGAISAVEMHSLVRARAHRGPSEPGLFDGVSDRDIQSMATAMVPVAVMRELFDQGVRVNLAVCLHWPAFLARYQDVILASFRSDL